MCYEIRTAYSVIHSVEIREEAVKEALQKEPILCPESLRPSKRRQPTPSIPEPGPASLRSTLPSFTAFNALYMQSTNKTFFIL